MKRLFVLIVVLLLIGCDNLPPGTPTITPSPTSTPSESPTPTETPDFLTPTPRITPSYTPTPPWALGSGDAYGQVEMGLYQTFGLGVNLRECPVADNSICAVVGSVTGVNEDGSPRYYPLVGVLYKENGDVWACLDKDYPTVYECGRWAAVAHDSCELGSPYPDGLCAYITFGGVD